MKPSHSKPQVELVDVYPEKHDPEIIATFHIYLADKDIDIRGGKVFLSESGNGIFVQVPQGRGTCDETGEMIQFPIVSFTDKTYEKAFRKEVIRLVREYMESQNMFWFK